MRSVKASRMSMIFISHDLALVSQVADSVLVLRDGCMVESNSANVFKHPQASVFA